MQIMPTNRSDSAFGLFAGTDSAASGFMDAMQDALSAVDEGYNHSVSSALSEDNQALVESPYSRQTTDGVTYTLEEVTFTKSELEELRQQLLKEGAPVESLRQFDALVDQPDGATLAQVLASLMGRQAGQFSEDDAHAITSLLNQIDPTGDLAGDALGFMRQGNGQAALGLIQDALDKLPADQRFEIDPDAMLALGRGLGLNAGTMQTIIGSMRGQSLSLSGDQFASLMKPAKAQFTIDEGNAQKLEAALEKTLKPLISKARSRMEKEMEAQSRESRRVQQSKILIDQTVQKNSREMMDSTLAGENLAQASEMTGHAGANRAEAGLAENGKTGKAASLAENGKIGKLVNGNEAGLAENAKYAVNAHESRKETPDNDAGDKKQGKSDGWQDLLGRIETKPTGASGQISNNSFVYSMLQGNLESQILDMDASMTNANVAHLNRQLSQQVEQGVLSAMRDGATRLDLQLHPAELGNVGITLIARNGEVTAQIRSEKSETAEMLQRQMDTIRVNLEQQGVKVDKIEVMLENKQESGGQFTDLGQHNARQEEETRRQEMARLRNLAALRNSDETPTAQNLHSIGQQARHEGRALHVVA
ncbi:MAG: flagellar hook-length control protein FliK [Desulfovibrio sp.]|nr:flagellar hook-length control protein FliK [Desulfovibrio sp.]